MEWCSTSSNQQGQIEGMAMNQMNTLEHAPLTAQDRCDRCGAQAYVRAVLASGGELIFCSHHHREFADGLKAAAIAIHDESDRITSSANER